MCVRTGGKVPWNCLALENLEKFTHLFVSKATGFAAAKDVEEADLLCVPDDDQEKKR